MRIPFSNSPKELIRDTPIILTILNPSYKPSYNRVDLSTINLLYTKLVSNRLFTRRLLVNYLFNILS